MHEIYSAYYNAMSCLINEAIENKLDLKAANEIINDTAFSDSNIYILEAIKNEEWQVITQNFKTPIKNKPEIPLTLLQKRWIKAIMNDKRFKLFYDNELCNLNVEPFYNSCDFEYFDIIKDGDPYDNENYIANFRIILKAIKADKSVWINYISGKDRAYERILKPQKLEYSQKDDKFRAICKGKRSFYIINIARIKDCKITDNPEIYAEYQINRRKSNVMLELYDERNALERCMLHFANFEKITEEISDKKYKMTLTYNSDDETEVLIRILSFGPMLKVISPKSFVGLIKERLNNQRKLGQGT